jgi:head-tail adaptor
VAKKTLGEYRTRLLHQKRELEPQGANGEEAESFADLLEYWAVRDQLSGGELITQGLAQNTGGMRLRIRGGSLPISAEDRLKNVVTDEVWRITGVAREDAETVLTCERQHQQTVAQ